VSVKSLRGDVRMGGTRRPGATDTGQHEGAGLVPQRLAPSWRARLGGEWAPQESGHQIAERLTSKPGTPMWGPGVGCY